MTTNKTIMLRDKLARGIRIAIELTYQERDTYVPYSPPWKALTLAIARMVNKENQYLTRVVDPEINSQGMTWPEWWRASGERGNVSDWKAGVDPCEIRAIEENP